MASIYNEELLRMVRERQEQNEREKSALVPAELSGGAGGGMPPGEMPMDPSMMGGGMPPGAMPMDPAMMGGGMPMDPNMMPPAPAPSPASPDLEARLAKLEASAGDGGTGSGGTGGEGGGGGAKPAKVDVGAELHQIKRMLANLLGNLGIPMAATDFLPPEEQPPQQQQPAAAAPQSAIQPIDPIQPAMIEQPGAAEQQPAQKAASTVSLVDKADALMAVINS